MRVKIELTREQVDAIRQQVLGEDERRAFGDEYQDYANRKLARGLFPKSYVEWLEDRYALLKDSDRREWRPLDEKE